MNFSYFIASKLAFSKDKTFTKVIVGIAIAAIALSITVMILANAMITGFKSEIHNKIFGFWGHLHITDSNINRDFELRPISLNGAYFQQIKNIKEVEYQAPVSFLGIIMADKYTNKKTFGGVRQVQPFIIMPGLIESKEGFEGVLFKGIDHHFNWQDMSRFVVEGPTKVDSLADNEIAVSKIIANKLNIKVGQTILMSFVKNRNNIKRKLNVKLIYNTGLEEYDRRFVIGNMSKVRPLLEWKDDEVAGIEVFCDNIEDAGVINDYIYTNILPDNLYSEKIQQKFPSIFEWLKLQDINEKVILQLMGVVAIINMITVLLILILERTRMIGVLKALGATNGMIRNVFLYYAAAIIAFGLVLGNFFGLGIAFLQKQFKIIKLDEANYYLDTAPIAFDWISILLINVLAFVFIIIFLVVPTFLIDKIKTIDILRFG